MYSELTRGDFCVVFLKLHSSGQNGGAKEATASSAGFRISKIGVPTYYLAILFPENRMKVQEIGLTVGLISDAPLDPLKVSCTSRSQKYGRPHVAGHLPSLI